MLRPSHRSSLVQASALALSIGLSAFGCQTIAGLSDYEIGPGPSGGSGGQGGTGGSTATSTSTTSSVGGSGGQGGMPECESPSDCGESTTCLTYLCDAGKCGDSKADLGTTCTEGGEVCDGEGTCVPAGCFDTVLNGDETDIDCGGSCSAKCANGDDCLVDEDCESTYCKQGGGAFGTCTATSVNGIACLSDSECESDHCTEGFCCESGDCVSQCLSCAVPNMEGTCQIYEGKSCGSSLDDDCTDPDTCDSAGNCVANHADAGTSCGNTVPGSCDDADTCDGVGNCDPNYFAAGTDCGSATTSDCDDADTCDAAGVCLTNHKANATACGGTCSGALSTPTGTCNNGNCSAATTDCSPYACKAGGTGCETICTTALQCEPGGFCATPPGNPAHCVGCGDGGPGAPNCNVGGVCETCSSGTCQKVCNVAGECSAGITLTATSGPATLDCGNQCAGITVTCQGPWPCSVHCGAGGCTGLTMICDPEGPCFLDCDSGACGGTVTQTCQQNQCTATCAGASTVMQGQGPSCSATKVGCL